MTLLASLILLVAFAIPMFAIVAAVARMDRKPAAPAPDVWTWREWAQDRDERDAAARQSATLAAMGG